MPFGALGVISNSKASKGHDSKGGTSHLYILKRSGERETSSTVLNPVLNLVRKETLLGNFS